MSVAYSTEVMGLQYFKIIDLWKRFCELHTILYDLTCEEYSQLLASNLDQLDKILKEKDEVVARIGLVEGVRQEVIQEINANLNESEQIKSVSSLIDYLEKYEQKNNTSLLKKMNTLLVDIIETIQKQNKKNQIFLNKAVHNLNELKQGLVGGKSYDIYNAQGIKKADVSK